MPEERVSLPRDSFDEELFLWRIPERSAQLVNGSVDVRVVVDATGRWPQTPANRIAGNNLARPLQKNKENLVGLRGQLNSRTVVRYLFVLQIDLAHD